MAENMNLTSQRCVHMFLTLNMPGRADKMAKNFPQFLSSSGFCAIGDQSPPHSHIKGSLLERLPDRFRGKGWLKRKKKDAILAVLCFFYWLHSRKEFASNFKGMRWRVQYRAFAALIGYVIAFAWQRERLIRSVSPELFNFVRMLRCGPHSPGQHWYADEASEWMHASFHSRESSIIPA